MTKPVRPRKELWLEIGISAGIILLYFVSRIILASKFGGYSFHAIMRDLFGVFILVVLFLFVYKIIRDKRNKRKEATKKQAAKKQVTEQRDATQASQTPYADFAKPLKDLLSCYRLHPEIVDGVRFRQDVILRVGIAMMQQGDSEAAVQWMRSAPDDRLQDMLLMLNNFLSMADGMQCVLPGWEWPEELEKARDCVRAELNLRSEAKKNGQAVSNQASANQTDAKRYMEDPASKAFIRKYQLMLQPYLKKDHDYRPALKDLMTCYHLSSELLESYLFRPDLIMRVGMSLMNCDDKEAAAEWMRTASDAQLLNMFLLLDNFIFDGSSTPNMSSLPFWDHIADARALVMDEMERRYGIVQDRFLTSDAGYAFELNYTIFTDTYEVRLYDLKGQWLPESCNLARFRLTEEEFREAESCLLKDNDLSGESEQLFLSLLSRRPGDRLIEMARLLSAKVTPADRPGQTASATVADLRLQKTDTGTETADDSAYEKFIGTREEKALHAIETAEKLYVPFCRANGETVPLMTSEEGTAVVFDNLEQAEKMLKSGEFGSLVGYRCLSSEQFGTLVKTWNRYGVGRIQLNPGTVGVRGFVKCDILIPGKEGMEPVCNSGLVGSILQYKQFSTNQSHPVCQHSMRDALNRITRALYHAVFLVPLLFDGDTKVTPETIVLAARPAAELLTEKKIIQRFGNPFAQLADRNPDDAETHGRKEVRFSNGKHVIICTQSNEGRLQLKEQDGSTIYIMDESFFFGGGEYCFANAEDAAAYVGKQAQMCTMQTQSSEMYTCCFTDFEYLKQMQDKFDNGFRLCARTFEEILPCTFLQALNHEGQTVPIVGLVINPGPHELRLSTQGLEIIAQVHKQYKRG